MADSASASAAASEQPTTHPLQFKWTLWHDVASKSKTASYAANLRKVASFDTVEDFWALFNNLMEPSKLPIQHTYNLFKAGIEPKWEDPQNAAGGEWRVQVPPSFKMQLDEYWVNTLLTVIGEGFSPAASDDIAGIVLNIKRVDRIAIWTKTALDKQLQESIGQRWKETSSILAPIEYIAFKDAMGVNGRGRPQSRYRIK